MSGQKDFLNLLREIRGTGAPGEAYTNGIWYELTVADIDGNPGIYGDILAKYGVVTESAGTFDQAVAILENLNVEVTTLPAGTEATSALVNGVWQLGIPRGANGEDGDNGSTPELALNYTAGNLNYTVTVDGVDVTSTVLDLDTAIDTIVNDNVDVQTTLQAKQDVVVAVDTAQALADSIGTTTTASKAELDSHTTTKKTEIDDYATTVGVELTDIVDAKVTEYDANAVIRLSQYDANHTDKLQAYNTNDGIKLSQYNDNHIERLEEINIAYAERIVQMLRTKRVMGMVDEYVAQTETHMIDFISTDDANYIYYGNGTLLEEGVDYTVFDKNTIELTVKANPYDVITQINTRVLKEMLTAEGALFDELLGVPDGIAQLDVNGSVPSTQLPSYVDDVLEVADYASLPVTGETGKIYVVVADETSGNDTSSYRWSGSVYAMVSNTLTAADIEVLYESVANTNKYTDAEKSKLDGVEAGATADQTAVEIETLYEGIANTNKFTDTEKQQLADLPNDLDSKQDNLVTGINIKTINHLDVLGSGNLDITIGSGGYAANVYFTTEPSTTVGTYNRINYVPEVTETILSAVANDGTTLMEDYIFDGDVLSSSIPAGEWGFQFNRYVSNTAGDTVIRFEIFKRSAVGTETVLFTVDSLPIEDVVATQESILVTKPAYTVASTDRVGIKVYAVTTRTSDTTVSMVLGDGNAAYFTTPLALRHNQLRARDEVDSHPIGAITGLQTALNELQTVVEW